MPEEIGEPLHARWHWSQPLWAVSFGAFVAAGQMVIDRYLQVILLVFWRI